ncbi:MAG TPA: STAS domain-containing protein [Spirochaetia bacterium]|nr:STAS domain-containing protein [Spirochaetales bacterium]HOT58586.1 STAS domain-containing protein [Spirochaetales bacterium]HPD80229.1 STAS domain-containing protein [Spirochaetales bacterium]HRS65237.1 STAS domain-containing protein [Spirochaetia bacterium]HRV27556.1 STAS domain-containing protein [Spirochaetia bacterium]
MEIREFTNSTTGVITIEIHGDLDLYAGIKASDAMLHAISNASCQVHVDLQNVSYLDSTGVGAIIKALQFAKIKNIVLSFSGIQGTPRKVLAMANILPLLREIDKGV